MHKHASALALTRPSISPILSAGAPRTSSTVISDSNLCPADASSSSHVPSTHVASSVACSTHPDGASPKGSNGVPSAKSDSDFGMTSCAAASNKPASPAKSAGSAVKKEDGESACGSKENGNVYDHKNNPKDKAVFDQKFDQKLTSRDQDARGDEDAIPHEKRKCDVKRLSLSKSDVECEGTENRHIMVDSRLVCMCVCLYANMHMYRMCKYVYVDSEGTENRHIVVDSRLVCMCVCLYVNMHMYRMCKYVYVDSEGTENRHIVVHSRLVCMCVCLYENMYMYCGKE
jgi:hypothetical protein